MSTETENRDNKKRKLLKELAEIQKQEEIEAIPARCRAMGLSAEYEKYFTMPADEMKKCVIDAKAEAARLTTLYEKLHLDGRTWGCLHGAGARCSACRPSDSY